MFIVHFRPVMLMAIDTGENRIVGRVAVTVGATVPFTTVLF